jgi:hypothetical protein
VVRQIRGLQISGLQIRGLQISGALRNTQNAKHENI